MKHIIRLLIICLSINISKGQESFYQENAIQIAQLAELSNDLYKAIADYRYLAIGEMHGTNEPAEFTISLAELLTRNGDSVIVGLEIPHVDMKRYSEKPRDKNIRKSKFFAKSYGDGRASEAWANVISSLNDNPKVKIIFYDTPNYDDNRDSAMFLNLKRVMLQNPLWKTITLSGNIHNMLVPFRGEKKMAMYLQEDGELDLEGRIFSFTHRFQNGSMINDTGNGLKLREVENYNSDYGISFENYFSKYPENIQDYYTGFFFTRRATAATIMKIKK